MRKMIIMVLAAGMLLPSLGAAVQNRFISDTWGERHTLTLHDSGAFALVKEEFRDQETYSCASCCLTSTYFLHIFQTVSKTSCYLLKTYQKRTTRAH